MPKAVMRTRAAKKQPALKRKPASTTLYRQHRGGISRKRLHVLRKQGKIKLKPNGEVDFQASDEAIEAARAAAQTRSPERKVKEFYEAKMAKLDYEKAVGVLVEKKAVEQEAFRKGRIVRDNLLTVSHRISGPIVAAVRSEKDDQKAQHLVEQLYAKEMRRVIEALPK